MSWRTPWVVTVDVVRRVTEAWSGVPVYCNSKVWELADEAKLAEVSLSPARLVVAFWATDKAALRVPVDCINLVWMGKGERRS